MAKKSTKMNKKAMYIALGVLVAVALILVFMQMTKGPVETTGTGEEIANCGDGTVIYGDEDLCWQRAGETTVKNWQAASDYCQNLALGDNDDWRLPSTDELTTIIDDSKENPVIDLEYFPGTEGTHYWTSSSYREGLHWYIHFELGYQGFAQDFRENFGVRCVRDNTLF